MNPFRKTAIVAQFILVLTGVAVAQTYSITDLGVLAGDTASEGLWIASNHVIVGCSDTTTVLALPCIGLNPGHAFAWTSQEGMQDLGTLPGGSYSVGNGANAAGEVVGFSGGPGNGHGFRWTQAEGMQDLGTLPGGTMSWATAINSNGWVAGYSDFPNSNGNTDMVVWGPSGNIFDLGALPGSVLNYAEALSEGNDVNEHGYVVGISFVSFNPLVFRATFWSKETGVRVLKGLPGARLSEATSLNSKGVVSGWSSTSGVNTARALLWEHNGTIHDLGTIPGWQSTAYDVNDNMQVVGFLNTATQSHAMLWTPQAGMQDLNQLIPRDTGWVLGAAIGINNEGEITGYGSINGENHAFLLTPQ